MKTYTLNELRHLFLDYYKQQDHALVSSSSLVPAEDPTLLFVNAGMVQFKPVFQGLESRSYTRATTAQKCVRAGGKHNDLENVGYTKRHHTFFEMLGSFSFGDYFKREAIELSWHFLTEVLEIPTERLWVTVYKDDKESEAIWLKELKIDPTRFSRCGEKDNFWSMGDTGPCGPCTEIFYDHGPEIPGGPPGSIDEDGDRYVEVWNLVFMQYDRNAKGEMLPLPKPCVDTGMGLERIATVMQGVHDNYDTDLFQSLLKALAVIVDCQDFGNQSMRVIVDHIRSSAFLIADGIMPSNEGRGYVLRRIIRRAVRHGFKLGMKEPFLYRLVPALVAVMGEAYPELQSSQTMIEHAIQQEERQFIHTLDKGLKLFEQAASAAVNGVIAGDDVFQLYDTYGFPPDLTADIARERGLTVDYDGFESAMAEQRQRSQKAQMFKVDETQSLHIQGETEFVGYGRLDVESTVTALIQDGKPASKLKEGEQGAIVLAKTPFYAESGGQVGDAGYLYGENAIFRVTDTQRHGKVILHIGHVTQGEFSAKHTVRAEVDSTREATKRNHSATHLLHEALRRVLGEHVQQKGSLVTSKRLRLDFSHPSALTDEQIRSVEHLVNQQIRANYPAELSEGSLEEAKAKGAMALFGEKYGEVVRVIKMGDFSTEVCGGTHVERTGDIGYFKIVQETSCASGIRRIEAVTAKEATAWVESQQALLHQLSALLKTEETQLPQRIKNTLEQMKQLQKQVLHLKQQLASGQTDGGLSQLTEVHGVQVLAANLPNMDRDTLRASIDQLKSKHDKVAAILATEQEGKLVLVAGVSKACLDQLTAPELLQHVAAQVDGRGGGRAEFAQGGGNDVAALPKALESVLPWIKKKLAE